MKPRILHDVAPALVVPRRAKYVVSRPDPEIVTRLTTNYLVLNTTHMPESKPSLTTRELAIMKVVWDKGGATVRDVHDALQRRRPVAYTTVMTLMNILQTKGYLRKRRSEERAYFYSPTRPRQQVLRALVADFVDRVFDGAAQPLRVHLVRDEPITDEERAELKRLIDSLED